jgi:hypothetical protein
VTWSILYVSDRYMHCKKVVLPCTEQATQRDGQVFVPTKHVEEIASTAMDNSRTTRDMFGASDTIQEESQDSSTRVR